jgi:hypothetical protein
MLASNDIASNALEDRTSRANQRRDSRCGRKVAAYLIAHELPEFAPGSSGYSLRFAGFPCSPPLSTLRVLNDTTVPGTRLLALIRRRPVPVNT